MSTFRIIKDLGINIIINSIGKKTNRKIIVLESDDWGMIRMKSNEALISFDKKGWETRLCHYNSNDSFERNEDLEGLFEVLDGVKDKNGNPAVLTANNVVANPNFSKIRDDNFLKYHYETFVETSRHYNGSLRVPELYNEGKKRNLFYPQLHGREHINVRRWMNALQVNDERALEALKHNMFSVHVKGSASSCRDEFLDALGNPCSKVSDKEYYSIIRDATDLFENIHGFKSKSFIAPCYTWAPIIESSLKKCGIDYIQGSRVQRIPLYNQKKNFKKSYHYTGQKNTLGQTYIVRNVFFEPSSDLNKDWVDEALKGIALSFMFNKPAIISTHRVNYIGRLNQKNRDRGLMLLKKLLKSVTEKWSDVEFLSSPELGDYLNK